MVLIDLEIFSDELTKKKNEAIFKTKATSCIEISFLGFFSDLIVVEADERTF